MTKVNTHHLISLNPVKGFKVCEYANKSCEILLIVITYRENVYVYICMCICVCACTYYIHLGEVLIHTFTFMYELKGS